LDTCNNQTNSNGGEQSSGWYPVNVPNKGNEKTPICARAHGCNSWSLKCFKRGRERRIHERKKRKSACKAALGGGAKKRLGTFIHERKETKNGVVGGRQKLSQPKIDKQKN